MLHYYNVNISQILKNLLKISLFNSGLLFLISDFDIYIETLYAIHKLKDPPESKNFVISHPFSYTR
jgi:hypothetical protein